MDVFAVVYDFSAASAEDCFDFVSAEAPVGAPLCATHYDGCNPKGTSGLILTETDVLG